MRLGLVAGFQWNVIVNEVPLSLTVESLKSRVVTLITDQDAQFQALMTLAQPIWIWMNGGSYSFGEDERRPHGRDGGNYKLGGFLPSLGLDQLGDRSFLETHHLRYPYMAGSMAHGIANTTLVIAMARAGMLGSYGSAGQSLADIEQAIDCLQAEPDLPVFAFYLIHSPSDSGCCPVPPSWNLSESGWSGCRPEPHHCQGFKSRSGNTLV